MLYLWLYMAFFAFHSGWVAEKWGVTSLFLQFLQLFIKK